jgi:hypothetical protein
MTAATMAHAPGGEARTPAAPRSRTQYREASGRYAMKPMKPMSTEERELIDRFGDELHAIMAPVRAAQAAVAGAEAEARARFIAALDAMHPEWAPTA